jgi:geranylgeranyl transferase type-2 subunit alpha
MSLIKEAINVGAEDQSLWFYYQFLMTNLTDDVGQKSMVAALSRADKAQYTTEEIKWIEELLDEFNDEVKALKWIYEALVERTLALPRLQNRELLPPEKERLRLALVRLRDLDPMRKGRWDDLQAEYRL